MSRLCARAKVICFFFKRQKNCHLTRQDFFPDRHANRDLLFTFSSNILDFQRSLSSYLKFGSGHEDWSRFYRKASRPENLVPLALKKSFSNVKLVSEVNCSESSNIHMICSRCSLKRLKDINKSAVSTLNAMNHRKG